MENTSQGFRSLALMMVIGLALAGVVVVGTAEPAEAIYVGWDIDLDNGTVGVDVCTGQGPSDPNSTCI